MYCQGSNLNLPNGINSNKLTKNADMAVKNPQ
jgi:hypothetical protein